eukprot:Rmarinus@m.10192
MQLMVPFISVLFLFGALIASSTAYDAVVVFGDSSVDTGNLYARSGETFPNSHVYPYHGFTNSEPWVRRLTELLDVPLYNYAVAGSTILPYLTNPVRTKDGQFETGSLEDQVVSYLAQSRDPSSEVPYPSEKVLFVFAGGIHDYTLTNFTVDPNLIVDELQTGCETLSLMGGVHFLIVGLPPLHLAPAFQQSPHAAFFRHALDTYGDRLNDAVFGSARVGGTFFSRQSHTTGGMDITVFDMSSFVWDLIDLETFEESVQGCVHAKQVCSNPDAYIWYDALHLSSHVHRLLADAIFGDLFGDAGGTRVEYNIQSTWSSDSYSTMYATSDSNIPGRSGVGAATASSASDDVYPADAEEVSFDVVISNKHSTVYEGSSATASPDPGERSAAHLDPQQQPDRSPLPKSPAATAPVPTPTPTPTTHYPSPVPATPANLSADRSRSTPQDVIEESDQKRKPSGEGKYDAQVSTPTTLMPTQEPDGEYIQVDESGTVRAGEQVVESTLQLSDPDPIVSQQEIAYPQQKHTQPSYFGMDHRSEQLLPSRSGSAVSRNAGDSNSIHEQISHGQPSYLPQRNVPSRTSTASLPTIPPTPPVPRVRSPPGPSQVSQNSNQHGSATYPAQEYPPHFPSDQLEEYKFKYPCPAGVPIANCLVDPCQFATCPAHPDAKCLSNYCGGCNRTFVDAFGRELNCELSEPSGRKVPTTPPRRGPTRLPPLSQWMTV